MIWFIFDEYFLFFLNCYYLVDNIWLKVKEDLKILFSVNFNGVFILDINNF